ncbi:MAG TPA: hypothetical protein VD794_12050 [Flavisolibacter sp.]|nr:hypothetical protein [Flavisolibacter sp.]
MKEWKLVRFCPIAEASHTTHNIGQTPLVPTKVIMLANTQTGLFFTTTDIDMKKHKRNTILNEFKDTYIRLFKAKEISIFTIVVDSDDYEDISRFIAGFKKKLMRAGLKPYGHIWIRDVGAIKFERHCHVAIVTDRCNAEQYNRLFKRKKHHKYNVQLCLNVDGFNGYLKDKELYGANRQRSFGRSRIFSKPDITGSNAA